MFSNQRLRCKDVKLLGKKTNGLSLQQMMDAQKSNASVLHTLSHGENQILVAVAMGNEKEFEIAVKTFVRNAARLSKLKNENNKFCAMRIKDLCIRVLKNGISDGGGFRMVKFSPRDPFLFKQSPIFAHMNSLGRWIGEGDLLSKCWRK